MEVLFVFTAMYVFCFFTDFLKVYKNGEKKEKVLYAAIMILAFGVFLIKRIKVDAESPMMHLQGFLESI